MFICNFPLVTDDLTTGTSVLTFSFSAVEHKSPSHARFYLKKKERLYAAPSFWEGPIICCTRIHYVICNKIIFGFTETQNQQNIKNKS